ncbi:MAG: NAD(P)/FAD-dependent oxidoreductase [Acidobacteria bacterium]|nr:NAD(P)/FAD-dependent oxidoreductase [Acidobacteriota bacterium]
MEAVDVAIIGAGPAGSTLAALLALRGVSVALLDRDSFPRDKLCGEFLSYDALPIVEALGVDLGDAPSIERCRVIGRHRVYEFAFPHPARGVSRFLLDDLLFRRALQLGAKQMDGVTATELREDRVGTDRGELRARVIVGAWGRWGRFDTQLARSFVRDRSHRNFGFKRHYREREAILRSAQDDNGRRHRFAEDAKPGGGLAKKRSGPCPPQDDKVIDLYSFRRGYLGVNAIEGGMTNICGLVHASRLAGHKGRWDAFVETIRGEEARLEELYARYEPAQDGFLSSEPVIFRARSAVEGGVFMIGDASGIIDPLTGNGMAMAIQSALVAAPHILKLLGGGERTAIENAYREEHRAMFGDRIRWSRMVARLLSRPALLDVAMRTVRTPAIGRLFLRRTRADRDAIARLTAAYAM